MRRINKYGWGLLALGVVAGLVVAIGGVSAATSWYVDIKDSNNNTTNIRFWANTGANPNLFIDPLKDGTPANENITSQAFMYIEKTLTGIFSGDAGQSRGEIAVQRTTTDATANAWMKSSSQAKVEVKTDGDVVITLGN